MKMTVILKYVRKILKLEIQSHTCLKWLLLLLIGNFNRPVHGNLKDT